MILNKASVLGLDPVGVDLIIASRLAKGSDLTEGLATSSDAVFLNQAGALGIDLTRCII